MPRRREESKLSPKPICWIVTDGRAGNVTSARGLAQAVGFPFEEKVIQLATPWQWIPPRFWPPDILGIDFQASDNIRPPWPDLIISCGRRSVGTVLELKRLSQGHILAVHVQHPRINPTNFDLVVAPAHDRLTGSNVAVTVGSVHGLTRAILDAAADEWRGRLAHVSEPRIAVLIGGRNKAYRLDAAAARHIGANLARLVQETGCGLMVTPSRRTDPAALAAMGEAFGDRPAEVWDQTGENPYLGYLGLADRVLVTGDSVNMVSEAAATERPVQVIHLPKSGGAAKFDRFHKAMEAAGITRPFDGTLAGWAFQPPDDTARAAERVRELYLDKFSELPEG